MIKESVELGLVRVVGLRVNLPDKGLAGPKGAHQRVFAADKVHVARPEQVVIVKLVQRWQVGEFQPILRIPAGVRAVHAGDAGLDRGRGTPRRHQQPCRLLGGCQLFQKGLQGSRLVTEQRDQAFALKTDGQEAQPGFTVEGGFSLGQTGLAQQTAGRRRESGVEEVLAQALGGTGQNR